MYIPDSHDPYPRHWKEKARKLDREESRRIESQKRVENVDKKKEEDCFVASAVYGDANAYEVNVLREYRDNVLMKSYFGRKIVGVYYGIGSERIANFVEKRVRFLIPIIRKGLDCVVREYEAQKEI